MAKKHHSRTVVHHPHHVEEKDTTYVKIDNALQTRKQILESAIDVTELMKRNENFKILRELKLKEMKKLELLVKKIKAEVGGYNRNMPKIVEVIEEEKKEMKMLHQMEMHKGEKVAVEPKDQLTGIDRELAEIKAKLDQLNI